MPTFPNIPNVPGVPPIPRQVVPAEPSAQLLLGSPVVVSKEVPPKVWGIFSSTNKLLLEPDNIVSVKDVEKSKVSNFPVEENAFASYNKVQEPFDVKVMMTKGGTSKEIEDFISTVRILKKRTSKLVSIVTPEDVFLSATLEAFDYSREAGKGQNLVHVLCQFVEVRQVSPKYAAATLPRTKVKSATAASKKDTGHVQPESANAKIAREAYNSVVPSRLAKPPGGL